MTMRTNLKIWLIVSLFLLVSPVLATDVNNPGFESEQDGLMPNGTSTSVRSTWAMPDNWSWRKLGNMSGHGIQSNDSSVGWSSYGDWALYVFATATGSQSVGDHIEFYQDVDLTGWDELSFDIYIPGSQNTRSYVAIDSQKLWTFDHFYRAELTGETVDISSFSGVHEIRLGVELVGSSSDAARGWTYFDNLTLSSGGAMMALFGTGELMSTTSEPKVIYVDADANGSNNGASWTNAYPYLQDALSDANSSAKPVELRVAQGTYTPDANSADPNGNGDREATFGLINGVTLKGGYAGDGEADPNARDITNYETILSGDLDGNDVQVATSDLLGEPTRAENSYHVVTGSGTDPNAVLDGFTMTGGNANETVSPNIYGGGMYSPYGSPTVLNCTFSRNSAYSLGGGMCTWDDVGNISIISNCNFNKNYAGTGGGMVNSKVVMTDCTFSDNLANLGGGMYNGSSSSTVLNCKFNNNSAQSNGGAIDIYGDDANPIFTNCIFSDNSAGLDGGAMRVRQGNPKLFNCTFRGNLASMNGGAIFLTAGHPSITAINCIFNSNLASNDGGAVYFGDTYSTLTNCTLYSNSAGGDGGGFCSGIRSCPTVTNCILWGNTATNGPQIALTNPGGYVTLLYIDYCDVEGGPSGVYILSEAALLDWGSGNITDNPLFVDADGPDNTVGTEDDNLHLLGDSNCIDAGDNTMAGTVPTDANDLNDDGFPDAVAPYMLDHDGNLRFVDDPDKTDTGNGTAPIVDMGAYEARRYIYVYTDAAGSNDGTDWANAYNYLQDGLSAAKGGWGEILVAEGTYKPDQGSEVTAGDRSATFQLKSGIDLTGGYAGSGEPDPNKRNINTYQSILSGDLDGNDVPITDPCELENEPSRAENSYHVVTGADNATIDGFTITAGNADGGGTDYYGAGLYNPAASPTVTNCTFSGNWASRGGGIYGDASSSPTVTGCILHSNASNYGGGMYNYSDSTEVTNCTFSNNLANEVGGGIYSNLTFPVLNSSILYGNTDSDGSDESAQIFPYFYMATPDVNYNCIQSWTGSWGGTGNIDSDPCFVDANNDDYHLRWASDCINTGDPNFTFDANERDIDSEPRVMVGRVDMGADETGEKQADFTRNGRIDTEDLGVFVRSWLTIPVDIDWYVLCDLQEDDQIDFKDYADLADGWLWQAGWYEP